jgi:hypothetical protein
MCKLIRLAFLTFMVAVLGVKTVAPQEQIIYRVDKPTVEFSISPIKPSPNDMITFTVIAQDNSGTGIRKISIVVNKREVKVCLTSPCVYTGGPYPEGSLSYGATVYDQTDNEPWTALRSVEVMKEHTTKDEGGLPGQRIDLIPLAEGDSTRWANGTIALNFPGEEGDYSGFARYQNNSLLEDNRVYSKVLLTYPEWRYEFGLIVGVFKIEDLPEKAILKTKVGFLMDASQSDGVEFRVFVNRDPSFYAAKECFYDGHLDDIAFNLDKYAGQNIEIVLQVNVLNTSIQDWAVWVDPRIEW